MINLTLDLGKRKSEPAPIPIGVRSDNNIDLLHFAVPDTLNERSIEDYIVTLHIAGEHSFEDVMDYVEGGFVYPVTTELTRTAGTIEYSIEFAYKDEIAATCIGEFYIEDRVNADPAIEDAHKGILAWLKGKVASLLTRVKVLEDGGGSGGTTDHDKLTNRDASDAHPASSIVFSDGESFQQKYDDGKLKGGDGDSFTYEDFNPEQLEALKGDAFTYEDFTNEQLARLEGAPGYTPVKGTDYDDGADGLTTSVCGIAQVDGNVALSVENLPLTVGHDFGTLTTLDFAGISAGLRDITANVTLSPQSILAGQPRRQVTLYFKGAFTASFLNVVWGNQDPPPAGTSGSSIDVTLMHNGRELRGGWS